MGLLSSRGPIILLLALALPALLGAVVDEGGDHTHEPVCYHTEFDEEGAPTGPSFCREDVWFHQAETKAGNLAATGQTEFPSWDTEEPTASVTEGAGGGYLGNGTAWQMQGAYDPAVNPTFHGSFTGNIESLAIDMYLFAPGRQNDETFPMGVSITIDGEQVVWVPSVDLPLEPGGDAVLRTEVLFTGLDAAMEDFGVTSDETTEHEIELVLTPYAIATTTAILVYDTTEVPSGMVFNLPPDEREGRFTYAL